MGESSQASSLGEELEAIGAFSEMKIYSFPGMCPLKNYPIHVVLHKHIYLETRGNGFSSLY